MRGRTALLNGPRMITPSRSKLMTLVSRWERAIHDPIDHAALNVDNIDVTARVFAERTDLDGVIPELDALARKVGLVAEREDAACAVVAVEVASRQPGRGWTAVRVAAHDCAGHVVTVGDQWRHQAWVVAVLGVDALVAFV